MNTVKFIVGLERGKFIEKEFKGYVTTRHTFEVREEEDGAWMYITIEDFSNHDALMLFHAGFEAGFANAKEAFLPKKIFSETVA